MIIPLACLYLQHTSVTVGFERDTGRILWKIKAHIVYTAVHEACRYLVMDDHLVKMSHRLYATTHSPISTVRALQVHINPITISCLHETSDHSEATLLQAPLWQLQPNDRGRRYTPVTIATH